MIVVAAEDPPISGVITQGAAMDGLVGLFGLRETSGTVKTAAMTVAGLRDAVRGLGRDLGPRRRGRLPVKSVREVAEILGDRAETLSFDCGSFDCGSFDIYVGDVFEQSVGCQVEFLRRVLVPTA